MNNSHLTYFPRQKSHHVYPPLHPATAHISPPKNFPEKIHPICMAHGLTNKLTPDSVSKMTPSPTIADIPALFIFDAAVGLHSTAELCAKYEYPPEYAAYLDKEPAFQKAVQDQIADLDKTGVSFKIRSGIVAEEAMMIIRERIKRGDTPTPVILDAFKTMAKFAGREPAPAGQQLAPGSGFSITINIPQVGTAPATSMVLESTAVRQVETDEPDAEYEYY